MSGRPEYTFGFESAKSKVGAGTSVLTHLAVVGVLLLLLRFAPQALPSEIADQLDVNMAVFLPTPGPGGGGGGGGDIKPEPVRKAQVEQKRIRSRFQPRSHPLQRRRRWRNRLRSS